VVKELDIVLSLDIVAANPYHAAQVDFEGETFSYEGDYSR